MTAATMPACASVEIANGARRVAVAGRRELKSAESRARRGRHRERQAGGEGSARTHGFSVSDQRLSTVGGQRRNRTRLDEREHILFWLTPAARAISAAVKTSGRTRDSSTSNVKAKGLPTSLAKQIDCKWLKRQQKTRSCGHAPEAPPGLSSCPGQGSDTGRGQNARAVVSQPARPSAARGFDEADALAGGEQPRGDETGVQQRPAGRRHVGGLRRDAEQAGERARRCGHGEDDSSARPQHPPQLLEQRQRMRCRAAARGSRSSTSARSKAASGTAAGTRSAPRPAARRGFGRPPARCATAAPSSASAYAPPVMPTRAASVEEQARIAADRRRHALPDADAGDGDDERLLRRSAAGKRPWPNDIVLPRYETRSNCSSTGQTRHPARRPRRRQHDHHRRRPRHPQGPREAHRLADPDGHDPPRQAHRGTLAADQRVRSPRRARRHRVRRLGHLRRELLRGGADGRRARAGAARADPARARGDQADARGVRSALREAARRARTSRRARTRRTSPSS